MARRNLAVTLAVLLSGLCLTCRARIYLVAAGVSDYPGTRNDLRLPAEDARTIAWLYGKNSDAERVLLLNRQATSRNILSAMEGLFANAGTGDIVVLFFSGHGVRGGFRAYDTFISYAQVRQAMAKCRATSKIIFADACFSGKIRTAGEADEEEEAEARKASVMLFLSSRSNEMSLERSGMSNGMFTTYLQKGLRGRADANRDRTVTAKELYEYVHERVVKDSGGRQHPVMWGNFSDTMPVMVW